ncbi:hypothetical protein BP5796_03750 [Coleophoma crateriformis]|uniref:Uncharacterized protein n=1 Tax=Coleophoma crateriformis TaxID=565419 RepID=A0A3D8SGF7_9HELO|nr:hypothetical protein BP5796_03750 [Coleophoma crateriformis]
MALQVTLGAGSLVAAGVGAGDIATLVTLGHWFGNWITAEKGDAEFLGLIEESEFTFLRRRGLIDTLRFQARWGSRLRLLENGRPQRFDRQPVERLLCSSSQWTVMMTCIVAALDEFASSSAVRNICKAFLQRLLSAQDGIGFMQDLIDSSVQTRMNGWRSAATVREMNIACRKIRDDLLRQGLVVQGFMPAAETHEVIDLLYWLLAQETEVFRTSSSDIAAIASFLCHLSFESLTIENFGVSSSRETNCCLVYDKAPLYTSDGRVVADARQRMARRELSTTVSLTQPEETFSTFPTSHETANKP